MATVRLPAVAGAFYDADPSALRSTISGYLDAAAVPEVNVMVRALIVPHAGYVYSGPVAGAAFRLMPPTKRVVLIGPSHFAPFRGVAVPAAVAFDTPLGRVAIDPGLIERAGLHDAIVTSDEPHAREHSLEVQLPFLQHLLGDFTMLPLLTGEVPPATAAGVLDELIGDDVAAVISSDLSHYLDYDAARQHDDHTAAAIAELRPADLAWDDACGRVAVQAALLVAQRRGWACRLLDLRNSGDTAGSRRRVVGYGAFALGPTRTGSRREPQAPGPSS